MSGASRWDFLRPWPWHYYLRISGIFFALGGAIELIMIKGGFYEHALKGAVRDADFNRNLAKKMLALHQENLRKKGNDGPGENSS